jgi:spore coat protein CotF
MDRISFHTYKYSIYQLSKKTDQVTTQQIIRYAEEVALCSFYEDDIRQIKMAFKELNCTPLGDGRYDISNAKNYSV